MKPPSSQSTLKLTHYGRKSGKPFLVTIWFADVGGELWIGSLDEDRGWVRNLRSTGRASVDFGRGPVEVRAERRDSADDHARYRDAVAAKYPILSRLVGLMVRGKTRAVFRLHAA